MTERQKLEKRLDDIVSEIVRKRDKCCITCGGNKDSAGHFMKRRHNGTRWNLTNVNAQCWDCNRNDDWEAYKSAMIMQYGEEVTENIITLAHSNVNYSNSDLKDLYSELLECKHNLFNCD